MTRLLSGLTLAGAAFAAVWYLPLQGLLAVALGLAALAFIEYARLVRAIGAPLPTAVTLVVTLAAVVTVTVPWVPLSTLLGVSLLAIATALMASGVHGAPLAHGVAAAVLAPVYLGLPLGALVAIHEQAGREGVLTLIAAVAASDTCQYYAGRAFGRRPLAPTISPKKTVEGAIGGVVVAPLVFVAIALFWMPRLPASAVWSAGVLMVVAGIAGDLFESAIKRSAGVKDSGTLIPGHGGVLDRIDALLFVTPLFYLLVTRA